MRLRIDREQRFTCSQCGLCCRRWDIAVTEAEVASFRRARVERWFREDLDAAEGAGSDPFEPAAGHGAHYQIRRRADGSCGFLSPANRCRIHEELGGARKPLSCRLFPFRVQATPGETVVGSSFCCPTIAGNEGVPLSQREAELKALAKEWLGSSPGATTSLELVGGRAIDATVAASVRAAFRAVLDRRGTDGGVDLVDNLARIAHLADDLARRRVTKLVDERLAEYVALVGTHAARDPSPPRRRRPGAVARLLSRGFLFATLAANEQVRDYRGSGLRLGLRLRLLRLLAHVHGIGSGTAGVDVRHLRRVRVELSDPQVHAIVYNYLRSTVEGLGTGHRPLLEELSLSVAVLEAAFGLGAMRAGRAGRDRLEAVDLIDGLTKAALLTHAAGGGAFAAVVGTLATGSDPLWRLAGRLEPGGAVVAPPGPPIS